MVKSASGLGEEGGVGEENSEVGAGGVGGVLVMSLFSLLNGTVGDLSGSSSWLVLGLLAKNRTP